MCSGRVDPDFILRAFSKGIDGVFIGSCHLNECNYVTHGNFHTLNTVLLYRKILEHIGLNPERLRIRFMSGAEANVFVESVNDFVKKIKELGPVGKAEGMDADTLNAKLAEVKRLVPYFKVALREKLATRLESHEEYDKYENTFTKEEIDKLFTDVVSYYIEPEKCQACMTCARRCPADAIISVKAARSISSIRTSASNAVPALRSVLPSSGPLPKIIGAPVPAPPPEGERAVVQKGKRKRGCLTTD